MKTKRLAAALLRISIALAIAIPGSPQDEDRPFFTLASNETFGPGGVPSVQVSAYGISALRIRVYRINDPVQFVRQLEDAHQFGGAHRKPRGKPSLLERLRSWKHDLRRDIRYDVRHQFTESPRAHLFPNRATETAGKAQKRVEYFADAPVLNSEQLVLSFVQPVSDTGSRWDTQKVEVPVKKNGLYLVEGVNGKLRAYTILNVSNLVLVTKTGRDHILYYVSNRKTGEPVENAAVTVMEKRNATGTTLHTGADGTAEFPLHATPASDIRSVASSEGDVAFDDIETWSFFRRERNLTGVVYTDRPVYRPGNTMHFRGILRYAQSAGYGVPKHESFSVQITDNDGKTVYQKQLSSSAQGVIHDELALAKDAKLGYYYIEARTGESTVTGNFEVQEYKKPEYEVHVKADAPRVLQGESTKVTIDSRYYFGEPVAGAKVKYSIFNSRYWASFWYDRDDEEEANTDEPNDYGYNNQTNEGEGTLDADGRFSFDLPTDVEEKKFDTLYRIEAGVTDKAGREISGTGWVVATYGSFLIRLEPDRWFYQPSQTASFTVRTRDYDQKPVSAPVHVELRSWDWTARSEGSVLASADVRTDAEGNGNVSLKLPREGGDYRVVSTAPSGDRTVESEQYVWVSGWSSIYGDADPSRAIQVVADKKTYKPGDTAQIMIATGQDNTPVLVTVEGRDIRSHSILRSKGGTAIFTYKVTRDDEPNFFVSAQFLRSGVMYQKEKRIKVPPEDHKLTIKLATDKPQYQPGARATYNIDVSDANGKPAAETDLSLGVVDEAIYAIMPDRTPDLVDVFYGVTGNSVTTENSLTYYFSGEAGTRRMQLAAIPAARKLAQLKPEQLVQPKIRKYFPDTTFWAADITTDAKGHAQAQFNFPDSLTTWRATARGASVDDRYGSATLKTIVRKNLILRLAVPRFFVQGDEVVISAIVHNYLQTGKQAKVNVKLQGLDLIGGAASQDVTVPLRGETKVDWRVKAQNLHKAKITAAALTDEESDALELELPINPPGVLIRQPHSGSIANAGQQSLTITYPGSAVTGSRSISIKLAPSVAGSIFSALEYLTAYPYGCVEQTMSSFLPDVIVTKAMRELNLKQPLDADALAKKTQAGLERLYGFHHEDGGWGWWTSDASHPFMTAYVVDGLSEARSAGVAVENDAIDKGDTWIEDYFAHNSKIPPDLHAYMAYALAVSGGPDKSALEQLYTERGQMSPYGLAILGLAFESVKDPRAGAIAADLAKNVRQDEREASWSATRDEMLDFSADITPETTAYATKLISHEQPNSPLLPKAALWLVDHRNEGFWWSSTKQTAMVIYGLIDYVKTTKELTPNLKARVRINGLDAGAAEFGADSLASVDSIVIDESKLRPEGNQIEIEASGAGRLYYSVSGDYYSNEAKAQNQGNISLNILRDYYRLVPQKTGGEIVYDLQPLNGPVAQGDVLAVRLTVTGSEWRYLLTEDPIPAGTEFVKDDNLYHLTQSPPWWQYFFTERENHDNRIAIFDDWFNGREQKQYFYVLKVVNPGLFHINPARVEPMYQPEYQATTGAATLEVK